MIIMHLIDLCTVQPYSPKKTEIIAYLCYVWGFEDTTLSSHKFTPVSDNFIQILNVSRKY